MAHLKTNMHAALDHQAELRGARKFLNSCLFDLRSLRGKVTNMVMLLIIILAVIAAMMGTISSVKAQWGKQIFTFDSWVLAIFAVEYIGRVYAARNRLQYVLGFYGVIDLLTVLPLFFGTGYFVLVRLLRLVRVIRVAVSFPVVRVLFISLQGSVRVLIGVLSTIVLISVLVGNVIFILEPQTYANAFEGTWWSLVTMSTVGFGDFVPKTPVGKALAACLIMSGICMFAMVTAVISVKIGHMVNYTGNCIACRRSLSPEYAYCPHCAASQNRQQAESADVQATADNSGLAT